MSSDPMPTVIEEVCCTDPSSDQIPPEEDLSHYYWLIVLVINGIFILGEILASTISSDIKFLGTSLSWTAIMMILHTLYTVASIVILGPQWQGSFVFLGRPLFNISSGPHYVPAGICSIARVTRLVEELELPGEPEEIWHGDESQGQTLPAGKVPPIRIPCKGYEDGEKEGSKNDLLALRLTIEPSFVVRFRIFSPTTFIVRVKDTSELKRQIQDIIVSACGPEFAKKTVAEVLEKWHDINELLDNKVNRVVTEWGVKVVNCQMKEAGIPHRTNSALIDLGVARSNSIATATRAEGEKKRLTLEGEGRASAIRSETDARTAGLFAQISALSGLPQELIRATLAAEAAPRVMREAKASVVLGSNANDLQSSLIGAAQVINKIKETEERS